MSLSSSQRSMSWNVEFFNFSLRFGGFYKFAGELSVADITHDLNICFVFDSPDNNAPWAPALILRTSSAQNLIILDQYNDDPFPTPTTDIHSYEYVFHRTCARPGDPHKIDNACIERKKSMVKRRYDQRYIDLGSKSIDARVAEFPTRSLSQPRTSSLKTVTTIPEELSFISLTERCEMNKIMSQYATDVFQACPSCVITGEGNYFGLQGPGLEAAHIIPQSQWNIYPIDKGIPDSSNLEQLKLAWRSTWDAQRNGIMLLSTLYKCFDARLIAFHPKTHRIRVFVDYSPLNKYYGQKVILPRLIPEEVWQHHWDMCCLENMVGTALPLPSNVTDIPELPRPKARKLEHRDPTKQGSSLQASDTQATDSQATSEQASEERQPWPLGKGTLNDPDTVQQVIEEDKVLEINTEYGRGRPRKRKQPGCTATEEHAGDQDGAHGVKKERV